jgi:hypothetical protein
MTIAGAGFLLLWACSGWAAAPADPVPEVDAIDLAKRSDLIGKEIIVDGRLAFFQIHDGIFDEAYLKKTTTVFRLPVELRSRQAPDAAGLRLQGVLKKESGALVFDVTAMTQLPGDRERLRQGVAQLAAGDSEGRLAWARWARRRGTEFDEPALVEKAGLLAAEAIRIEAKRPGVDLPDANLRLAHRARDLGVPEPDPSALIHRAFRQKLNGLFGSTDLDLFVKDVESLLPVSRSPLPIPADLADWEGPYHKDPAEVYRKAPEPVRRALDRRLLLDILQKRFERQIGEHPDQALTIAGQIREQMPDRPAFATSIEAEALARMTDNDHLKFMTVNELRSLLKRFEARSEPTRVQDVTQRWLQQQRNRLRPTDAEARVALATHYESMLNDRLTALELLRESFKIDPSSKETDKAFRRLGFRKVGDQWVDAKSPAARVKTTGNGDGHPPRVDPTAEPLQNMTRAEVRAQLGEPTSIARSASQGELLEQWIYEEGAKRTRYVNFLFRAGMAQPIVEHSYLLSNP